MSDSFDLLHTKLPNGTMLLEASAGTGKTFTITGIVLRLLLERRVTKLSEILVVTFTVAATQELKTRIRKALQDGMAACERGGNAKDPFLDALGKAHGKDGARRLRQALQQADEMSVATIHSFCKRVLDEAAFSSATPFRIDFAADDLPIRADASRDAVRLVVQSQGTLCAAVARHEGLLPDDVLQLHKTFSKHEGTKLLPEPEPLDVALAKVRASLKELRQVAESGGLPTEILLQLNWDSDTKKKPWGLGGPERIAQLQSRLLDDVSPDLKWIEAFSRDYLEKNTNKRQRPSLDQPFFLLCQQAIDRATAAGHSMRKELLLATGQRIERDKTRSDRMSFDDLLRRVDAALADDGKRARLLSSLRGRYEVAVIDEFQDTDPAQYRVFATCFEGRGLYLVGDPKQSIYGFRGADVLAYMRARDDAQQTHSLGHNHRSHPDLVAAVSAIFCGPGSFLEPGIVMPRVEAAKTREELALPGVPGPAMQIRCLRLSGRAEKKKPIRMKAVARDVAHEIARLLADPKAKLQDRDTTRRLLPSDFAVLTRTNVEAQAVQDALRARGVHSAIGRAGNVFECPEYDDLRCLLRALGQGQQLKSIRALWFSPLYGLDAAQLAALDADEHALQDELLAIESLRREWVRHGFLAMFQQLLARTDARARLLSRPDGERKLTNYLQVAELLHHAEHEERLRGDGLLHWMERLQRNSNAIADEIKELRLESDAKAVRIQTVHGSKGLQYEIVFVPFPLGGREAPKAGTPVLARADDGTYAYDFGSDQRASLVARMLHDDLAESLRLLYVAVTRARRRCVVHAFAADDLQSSALGYLLIGPGRNSAAPDVAQIAAWREKPLQSLDTWKSSADALAEQSAGTIAAEIAQPATGGAGDADGDAIERIQPKPRALPKRVRAGHRTTSYTQLAKLERVDDESAAIPVGRMADEPDLAPKPAEASAADALAGMYAFARGAAAGDCLHKILERVDFANDDDAALRQVVDEELRAAGLHRKESHRGPIDPVDDTCAMVETLRRRKLPGMGFCLRDTKPQSRRAEWRFLASASRMLPNKLAEVFATHGGPQFAGYADRLRTMPAEQIDGFLTGSIDLLVEHGGKHWVVDWKSNWLGARAEDYDDTSLWRCVVDADYVLQYCLYLVAVCRQLRARIPGYDYDQHVGGACYVFLRALDSDGHDHGFHVRKPPRALIEALDAWLSAGAGAEA